jgi:DNA-binding GntR family transcriptional regulator
LKTTGDKMVTNKSLRMTAYKYIKDSLLSGKIKPGERIFTSDLSNEISISTTPVREALLLLTQEKLLEANKRNGFIVKQINISELEEYFYYRELLESKSVDLILNNIQDDELLELEKIIEMAESVYRKKIYYEFSSLHFEFHNKLWESTHSKIFTDLMSSMNHIFIQIISLAAKRPESIPSAIKDHRNMLESIHNRDSKKLSELIASHIRSAKNNILPLYSFFS